MLLLKISIKCIIFAYNSTNNWEIVCADISTCDTNALMKRLWCWEGLGAGGERDNTMRWLDGITNLVDVWVWVNSGSWWWTGRPDVLRFMGLQSWTRLSDWTELTDFQVTSADSSLRLIGQKWVTCSSSTNHWKEQVEFLQLLPVRSHPSWGKKERSAFVTDSVCPNPPSADSSLWSCNMFKYPWLSVLLLPDTCPISLLSSPANSLQEPYNCIASNEWLIGSGYY